MIRCILIDDEQPARELVKKHLSSHADFEVIAECSNGFDGFKAIKDHEPDLIFLDIQMPKLTGFEMLELLDKRPHVIFITAYDQFAIKAFEHNAIDYLLKPYTPDRIATALKKARERIDSKEPQQVTQLLEDVRQEEDIIDRVVVKDRSKIDIIPVDEIWYIQAEDDYVMLHTKRGRFLKKATMHYFEGHLPSKSFVRVHRSYIIHTDQIKRMERYEKETFIIELKCNETVKTSKTGAKRLKQALGM